VEALRELHRPYPEVLDPSPPGGGVSCGEAWRGGTPLGGAAGPVRWSPLLGRGQASPRGGGEAGGGGEGRDGGLGGEELRVRRGEAVRRQR